MRRLMVVLMSSVLWSCGDDIVRPEAPVAEATTPVSATLLASRADAAAGESLRVAIDVDGAEAQGVAAVQGAVRFDATRLRYVGQVPAGGQVVVVDDSGAESGALRLVSFGVDGFPARAAVLEFAALGAWSTAAPGITFDAETALPGGGVASVRVDAVVRVEPSMGHVTAARRMSYADWSRRLGFEHAGPRGRRHHRHRRARHPDGLGRAGRCARGRLQRGRRGQRAGRPALGPHEPGVGARAQRPRPLIAVRHLGRRRHQRVGRPGRGSTVGGGAGRRFDGWLQRWSDGWVEPVLPRARAIGDDQADGAAVLVPFGGVVVGVRQGRRIAGDHRLGRRCAPLTIGGDSVQLPGGAARRPWVDQPGHRGFRGRVQDGVHLPHVPDGPELAGSPIVDQQSLVYSS